MPVAALSRKVAGNSCHLSSPVKRKNKVSRNPVKLPRQFEVSSHCASSRKRTVVDDTSFASALASEGFQGKTRKSGRDRKSAPVFQGGMP